ncbi:hypothetical protein [Pseudonocardia dioxanivorans]|uniref:hypothetical protein n=1 Tax=Pseudonocardia dioxanivorans TaxID=240495 RepID=UPI00059FE667|nr:hypothetical protein [Pseudonocardia dioxanivorans]
MLVSPGIGLDGGVVAVTAELFMLVAGSPAYVELTWVRRIGWHRDHVGIEQLAEEEQSRRARHVGL